MSFTELSKERRRRKIREISWKTFAGGGRRHFVRSEIITDVKFNLGMGDMNSMLPLLLMKDGSLGDNKTLMLMMMQGGNMGAMNPLLMMSLLE